MEDVERGEDDIHNMRPMTRQMFGLPRVPNFGHTKFTIKLLSSGRFASAFFGMRSLTLACNALMLCLECGTEAA